MAFLFQNLAECQFSGMWNVWVLFFGLTTIEKAYFHTLNWVEVSSSRMLSKVRVWLKGHELHNHHFLGLRTVVMSHESLPFTTHSPMYTRLLPKGPYWIYAVDRAIIQQYTGVAPSTFQVGKKKTLCFRASRQNHGSMEFGLFGVTKWPIPSLKLRVCPENRPLEKEIPIGNHHF